MGTKKKAETQEEEVLNQEAVEAPQSEPEVEKEVEAPSKKEEPVIPAEIDHLLSLYPQYEELWVTKEGFVHPKNVSKALRENATLYKNKYYEQNND